MSAPGMVRYARWDGGRIHIVPEVYSPDDAKPVADRSTDDILVASLDLYAVFAFEAADGGRADTRSSDAAVPGQALLYDTSHPPKGRRP